MNHDEPALSICSTLWAYVVFFHILFYSVHPSQFRSAPGSGSWNLSRQDILCYIVFFSPLNMTEPGQSFLREESVYWLYVGIFTDGRVIHWETIIMKVNSQTLMAMKSGGP